MIIQDRFELARVPEVGIVRGRERATTAPVDLVMVDEEDAAVFLERAQRLKKVELRGFASVLGLGHLDNGMAFMAVSVPEGETLAKRIASPTATVGELLRLMGQLLTLIARLHGEGLVHGNLGPHSIVITGRGRFDFPALTSFALMPGLVPSRSSRGSVEEHALATALVPREHHTKKRAAPFEPSDDLYSLGVTLHFAIAGVPPFVGHTRALVEKSVFEGRSISLHTARPDLPADFAEVVDHAKDPVRKKRFTAATDLRRALMTAAFRSPDVREVALAEPGSLPRLLPAEATRRVTTDWSDPDPSPSHRPVEAAPKEPRFPKYGREDEETATLIVVNVEDNDEQTHYSAQPTFDSGKPEPEPKKPLAKSAPKPEPEKKKKMPSLALAALDEVPDELTHGAATVAQGVLKKKKVEPPTNRADEEPYEDEDTALSHATPAIAAAPSEPLPLVARTVARTREQSPKKREPTAPIELVSKRSPEDDVWPSDDPARELAKKALAEKALAAKATVKISDDAPDRIEENVADEVADDPIKPTRSLRAQLPRRLDDPPSLDETDRFPKSPAPSRASAVLVGVVMLGLGGGLGWLIGAGHIPVKAWLGIEEPAPPTDVPIEPDIDENADPDLTALATQSTDAGAADAGAADAGAAEEASDAGSTDAAVEEDAGDAGQESVGEEVAVDAEAFEIRLRGLPRRARVRLDSEDIDPRSVSAIDVPNDGAPHTIQVRVVGYRTWEREVASDDAGEIEIELERSPRRRRRRRRATAEPEESLVEDPVEDE